MNTTKEYIEFEIEQTTSYKPKNLLEVFDKENTYIDPFSVTQKEKIKISKKILNETLSSYSIQVGFNLSVKNMLMVILSDGEMTEELKQCSRTGRSNLTDTICRDKFCDAFARYLLNDERYWPRGGDSEKYTNKFFKDLRSAAKKKGIK